MARKKEKVVVEPVNDDHVDSPLTDPATVEAQREDSIFKATDFEPNFTPDKAEEVDEADKKDTPEVDIEQTGDTVVALQRKPLGAETKEDAEAKEELAEEKEEVVEEDPEMKRLEEEVAALKEELEKRNEEIGRLNKEILESPAEKYRAELDVARRENEILIGSVQKPNRQIFG